MKQLHISKLSPGYRRMRKRMAHVHPMIAEAALEIIMVEFDNLMHDDHWWKMWKIECDSTNMKVLETKWLEKHWLKGVEAARTHLARMLDPAVSPSLDETQRSCIHEALILDASLRMGRVQRNGATLQ